MRNEAHQMDDQSPESGERPVTDAELKEQVRNHELEQKLKETEPKGETLAGGERFLHDADEYLGMDAKIRAKMQEIKSLDSRVPPGSNTKEAMAQLQSELKSLMESKDAIPAKYGEDAELFHADAESLADLRAKIDDRKAKIDRVSASLTANEAAGKPDAVRGSLLKGLNKELGMLEQKYGDYKSMLVRNYGGDTADARKSIDDFEIDTLLGETDKEIEAALAPLDAQPEAVVDLADDEYEQVTDEMLLEGEKGSNARYDLKASPDDISEIPSADASRDASEAIFKSKMGQSRFEMLRGKAARIAHELKDTYGIDKPVTALAERSKKGAISRFFGGLFSKKDALLNELDGLTNEMSDIQAKQNEEANRVSGDERYKQAKSMGGRGSTRLSSGEGRGVEKK